MKTLEDDARFGNVFFDDVVPVVKDSFALWLGLLRNSRLKNGGCRFRRERRHLARDKQKISRAMGAAILGLKLASHNTDD